MISINDLAGLVLGMITVAGFDDDGRSCPVVSAVEVDPAREDPFVFCCLIVHKSCPDGPTVRSKN